MRLTPRRALRPDYFRLFVLPKVVTETRGREFQLP
jgi:hypothetical protein